MRLIPSDTQDFSYTVGAFTVEIGGALKVKLYDGTVETLTVPHGGLVNQSVRRIFRTGTTCSGFQTDIARNADYSTRNQIVPYAGELDEVPTQPLYIGTGAIELDAVTAAGTGTRTVPVYTGTGTPETLAATADGTGTHTDMTPPTVASARAFNNQTTGLGNVEVTFSTAVDELAGSTWTATNAEAEADSLTYVSGSGTTTVTFSTGVFTRAEMPCTLAYSAGSVQSVSGDVALATFSGQAVTDEVAPIVTAAQIYNNDTQTILAVTFSEEVFDPDTLTSNFVVRGDRGGDLVTYIDGTNTTLVTFSLDSGPGSQVDFGFTVTLDYDTGGDWFTVHGDETPVAPFTSYPVANNVMAVSGTLSAESQLDGSPVIDGTDTSVPTPASWNWEVDDGLGYYNFSGAQNPTNIPITASTGGTVNTIRLTVNGGTPGGLLSAVIGTVTGLLTPP